MPKAATFEAGLAILSKEAYENISAIALKIKDTNYRLITVEGHADSTGREEKNLRLSEERARAVYLELASKGIPRDKLKMVYFGSSMPIDTNATIEGREANRRVKIFVE
jgi:outer membrane protein OmpA-like peptidoglycan-associated protein